MHQPKRRHHPNIRDQALLDALEKLPQKPFIRSVWRSVREGADPLTCSRSGGRWDDGTLDVLYTSESRSGAIAERRFHLYQGQPFPPSKVRYEIYELEIELSCVVEFANVSELAELGLKTEQYGQLSYLEHRREYARSQQIAEACAFMGADGLKVPNARDLETFNVIVFCEQPTIGKMSVIQNFGLMVLSPN
ncbi:MAG: RES family NAD+ phosphorylase [Gammaproteobacteria bacterium]|nr:RES family NAD+ phosphorylase [Gammaproteobacteria bacterium]